MGRGSEVRRRGGLRLLSDDTEFGQRAFVVSHLFRKQHEMDGAPGISRLLWRSAKSVGPPAHAERRWWKWKGEVHGAFPAWRFCC